MDEPNPGEEPKKLKIRPRGMPASDPEASGSLPAEGKNPVGEVPLAARLPKGRDPFPTREAKSENKAKDTTESAEDTEDPAGESDGDEDETAQPRREKVRRRRHHRKADKPTRPSTPASEILKRAGLALWNIRVRAVPIVGFALLILLGVAVNTYQAGVGEGNEQSLRAATMERIDVPPEFATALDQALIDLRDGQPERALQTLEKLGTSFPNIGSLSYVTALAALQNGDTDLADRKLNETIEKRERVSDALALRAVVESVRSRQPGYRSMGNPKIRVEALLRQAIRADSANPFPRLELSTVLRHQGRREEALAELRAARARLNPVDSHTVVDVTSRLIELEVLPDDKLPEPATVVPPDAPGLFSEAYLAMRRKDFDRAAALLKAGRERMAPDLFYYIVNDPALRRSRGEAQLAEFFR